MEIKCTINRMRLNHPNTRPLPRSVEKLSSTKPVLDAKKVGDRCPRGLMLEKCSADVRGWGGRLLEPTEHRHLSNWRGAHQAEPTMDMSTARLPVGPAVLGVAPAPSGCLCWRTKLPVNTRHTPAVLLEQHFPAPHGNPKKWLEKRRD